MWINHNKKKIVTGWQNYCSSTSLNKLDIFFIKETTGAATK